MQCGDSYTFKIIANYREFSSGLFWIQLVTISNAFCDLITFHTEQGKSAEHFTKIRVSRLILNLINVNKL